MNPSDPSHIVVEQLVQSHAKFRAFVAARVSHAAEAEEILQAAFVRGIEKASVLREDESVVPWFYRLLRNAVIDYYRHRDVERRALERLGSWGDDPSTPAPELADAICQCMKALLPTLKEEYAKLLQAIDLEGRDVADMAQALGLTPNNTRVKLHRARKALRKQLEISCGTCTEHGCLDCTCGA